MVALYGQLRSGLLELRLGCLELRFAPLQLRTADEVLLFECNISFEVSRRQIAVDGSSVELRARCVLGQFVVLWINLRQHLPGFDVLTQLRLTLDDLAAHPKAQTRLALRLDFA